MKERTCLLSLLTLSLLFAGCESFFSFNLYSLVDGKRIDLENPDSIISGLSKAPEYQLSKMSEEERQGVIAAVRKALETETDREKRNALNGILGAANMADAAVKTEDGTVVNPADKLGSVLVTTALSAASSGEAPDYVGILSEVFPVKDPKVITEQIQSLRAASLAYNDYGKGLSEPLTGEQAETCSMNALTAGAVAAMVDQIPGEEDDAVEKLAAFLADPRDAVNPFQGSSFDGAQLMQEMSSGYSGVINLVTGTSLGSVVEQLAGGVQ